VTDLVTVHIHKKIEFDQHDARKRDRQSHESHKGVTFCPTCHHPIPTDDIAAGFSPIRRQIYELIRDAGAEGITRLSMEQLVYADARGGGPETNSIAVTICRGINPVLKTRGLVIRSRQYRFRLERITP
jgi:hypothetical protein